MEKRSLVCPYCHGNMREGYVNTLDVYWIPKGYNPRPWYPKDKSKGFSLRRYGIKKPFHTVAVNADFCPTCNKVIIDCNVPESEDF